MDKWIKHHENHDLFQVWHRPGTWCEVKNCEVNKDGKVPEANPDPLRDAGEGK